VVGVLTAPHHSLEGERAEARPFMTVLTIRSQENAECVKVTAAVPLRSRRKDPVFP
jgi:hypothetical protein